MGSGRDLSGHDAGNTSISIEHCPSGAGVSAGGDDLQLAGCTGPKGGLHHGIALAGGSAGWDNLDGRHRRTQAQHRAGESKQGEERDHAEPQWVAPQEPPPGLEASRAVFAGVHLGKGKLVDPVDPVDPVAQATENSGQQGEGASQDESDGEHYPHRHRTEGGGGNDQDGGQADQHG